MRFLAFLLPLVFACSSSTVVLPVTPAERAANVEHVMRATAALVHNGRAYCTGVFWKKYIVTAHHCVDDSDMVEIAVLDDMLDGDLAYVSPDIYEVTKRLEHRDLALLSPVHATRVHTSVRFADRDPYTGERVFLVGHSLGRYLWNLSEGRVAPGRREMETSWASNLMWFMTSANALPGNSGGPCLTEDGELLGILSFGPGGHAFPSGVIHPRAIRELLQGH